MRNERGGGFDVSHAVQRLVETEDARILKEVVRKSMKNERDVKAAIKAILQEHGVWYFMPAMNGFGRPGIPDVIACVNGKLLGIEAKYGRNYCSSLQEMEGKKIEKAGGKWLVVYETNVDDVRVAVEALKRGEK